MPKTDNRTNGGRFEQELAERLSREGFWVHVLQQNKAGQPADIIAVKGKFHTLIDCKVISDERGFPLKRMEENQKQAMTRFCQRANENCFFAMKLADGSIWMIGFTNLVRAEKEGHRRIPEEKIRLAWDLNKWLESANVWAVDV